MTEIIEARNISFAYNSSPVLKDKPAVLRDLSFTLHEGDVMFIAGESGSGKTTLLRLLVGLESPANGELLFRDRSYAQHSLPALRKYVAYLQQLPVMIDASVRDNLLLSFRYDPNDSPPDSELLSKLEGARLGTVGLDQPARELSVGQKQRISLLRLLLMRPAVLLLDEPLAALDEISASAILELLSIEIRQRGTAMMLVSHVLPGILEARSRSMTLIDGNLKETHA